MAFIFKPFLIARIGRYQKIYHENIAQKSLKNLNCGELIFLKRIYNWLCHMLKSVSIFSNVV